MSNLRGRPRRPAGGRAGSGAEGNGRRRRRPERSLTAFLRDRRRQRLLRPRSALWRPEAARAAPETPPLAAPASVGAGAAAAPRRAGRGLGTGAGGGDPRPGRFRGHPRVQRAVTSGRMEPIKGRSRARDALVLLTAGAGRIIRIYGRLVRFSWAAAPEQKSRELVPRLAGN